MSDDMLRYAPSLRYATLWWIWGRPGPAGGWQLRLPDAPDDQVLRPPQRGMPPEEISAWMEEVVAEHGWRRHNAAPWPPFDPPPFVTEVPVVPAEPDPTTEVRMTS
ncbi:hypothetical protein ACQPYK_50145 (plasmid) [Streptosporangium sp. CA-135522]|uniref:hypothetical protein n=1 Tax=Streptosporangium sp. CA-135522 TaxID=3240072 RepID=UPI003D8AD23F